MRSLNFLTFENRKSSSAASLFFALFIGLQLAAVLLLIRYFFRPTWDQHTSSGLGPIVATMLVCNVVFCFGEYLFHRYLLHVPSVRFLRSLCSSHLTHHKLTPIQFDDATQRVRSGYAITDVEHDDQSTFPPWALLAFIGFLTPLFAVVAFSFPKLPILIGGYAAIAIAHFLYETVHAVHHQPYQEFWAPRLAAAGTGPLWRRLYGFHLAHHANYRCNMNVAGFFGLPLGDLVFGTYKQPAPLLIEGVAATKASARDLTPQPRWPISRFDALILLRRRRMSKEH